MILMVGKRKRAPVRMDSACMCSTEPSRGVFIPGKEGLNVMQQIHEAEVSVAACAPTHTTHVSRES